MKTKNKIKIINPKIFELSWSDGRGMFSKWLFTHHNKTKKEFREDLRFLLRKYGKEYLEQEEGWAGAERWTKFIAENKMSELGYVSIRPILEHFSYAFIIDNNKDKDIKNWCKVVGDPLLKKAILHNKKVRKELKDYSATYLQED